MRRLSVALLAVLLLACGIGPALASAPTTTGYALSTNGPFYSSPSAACAQLSGDAAVSGQGGNSANYYCVAAGAEWWQGVQVAVVPVCADYSYPNTDLPLAQQCVDPDPPKCKPVSIGNTPILMAWATGYKSGSAIAKTITTVDQLLDGAFCSGGCEVRFTAGQAPVSATSQTTAGPNGYYPVYSHPDMTKTGSSCSAGPPGSSPSATNEPNVADNGGEPTTPPPSTPGACPAGSVAGGLDSDGMTICIGKASTPTQPSTITSAPVTVTNADGSTTTTVTTTTINSDGSTTTTKDITTKNPDGSSSHSQTAGTTAATGGGPGATDPTPDDFCAKHAELTMCRNSTVSGACAAVSCTGDAIQCATLQAAATMNCREQQAQDDQKNSPEYALGAGVLSGSDPAASSLPSASNASTVDMPGLDQSGWLGGGACFVDKTLDVMGHSVLIPFSKACDYLIALRYAVMVIAALASLRVLSGAIFRE